MNCPECFGEKIRGYQNPMLARGFVEYTLECQACGCRWTVRRGTRTAHLSEERRAEIRKEWSNVEMEPDRLQRLEAQRMKERG